MSPGRVAAAILLCMMLSAKAAPAAPSSPVTVLLLSDIHFDPFATETVPAQCGEQEPSTTPALMDEVLREVRLVRPRFTVLTGDLVVHQMQCRFLTLHPGAPAEAYAAFAERVVAKVLDGLSEATGGRPVLVALGNHDSGCGNYRRDIHDPFLARIAPLVSRLATSDPAERKAVSRSFATTGGYWIGALPGLPNVGAAVIDTTPLSREAKDCSGASRGPDAEALAWLDTRLAQQSTAHRTAWIVGHIPPGVDVRATVAADNTGRQTIGFQQPSRLDDLMARSSALRLALFGHSHMDEWRLHAGIPLRGVPAVSPISGNLPALTVASIAQDGTMLDYRVLAPKAADARGRWRRWYAFRATYGAKAFDAAALGALEQKRLASRAFATRYRRLYSVGNPASNFLNDDDHWRLYRCATVTLQTKNREACGR